MAWTIEYKSDVAKQIAKLDRQTADRILDFLEQRLVARTSPRDLGEAMAGPMKTFWRYRVGNHRVIREIIDDRLIVLVVRLGNRKDVYR